MPPHAFQWSGPPDANPPCCRRERARGLGLFEPETPSPPYVRAPPSSPRQALVAGLFDEWAARHEGDATVGFEARMAEVAQFYEARGAAFAASAERHLTGLARWTVPTAGMFVWLELLGVDDSHALITEHAVSAKVLLVPGTSFMPCGSPSPYVRAAFSTATPDDIDEALRRLAGLLVRMRA